MMRRPTAPLTKSNGMLGIGLFELIILGGIAAVIVGIVVGGIVVFLTPKKRDE